MRTLCTRRLCRCKTLSEPRVWCVTGMALLVCISIRYGDLYFDNSVTINEYRNEFPVSDQDLEINRLTVLDGASGENNHHTKVMRVTSFLYERKLSWNVWKMWLGKYFSKNPLVFDKILIRLDSSPTLK